jgi:hypothetical protein
MVFYCLFTATKVWIPAFRSNIRQLDQCLSFFVFKKPFLTQKMYALLKQIEIYLLITRVREEISQKFQRIWIQQAKGILLVSKIHQNS